MSESKIEKMEEQSFDILTYQNMRKKDSKSIWEWSNLVVSLGTASTEDWTPAFQKAINYSFTNGVEIYVPPYFNDATQYSYYIRGHITIPIPVDGQFSHAPTLIGNAQGMYTTNKNYGTVNCSKIVTWNTDYTFTNASRINIFGIHFNSQRQWMDSLGSLFKEMILNSEMRWNYFNGYDTVFGGGIGASEIQFNGASRIKCFIKGGGGDSDVSFNFLSGNPVYMDTSVALNMPQMGLGIITNNWMEFFGTGINASGILSSSITNNRIDYCYVGVNVGGYDYIVSNNIFTHIQRRFANNTNLFGTVSDNLKNTNWTAIKFNYTKGATIMGNISNGADLMFNLGTTLFNNVVINGNRNTDGYDKNTNGTKLYTIVSYGIWEGVRFDDFDYQILTSKPSGNQIYDGMKFYYNNKLIRVYHKSNPDSWIYYDMMGANVTATIP